VLRLGKTTRRRVRLAAADKVAIANRLAGAGNVATFRIVRRLKEILVLAGLLLAAVVFVIWYVIDRRAQNRSAPIVTKSIGPLITGDGLTSQSADGKTLNLSGGQAIISNTPEDQRAIVQAMSDINAALGETVFTAEDQAAAAKRDP